MTKIDIISGFLGAGKTTFIQKLINEGFGKEKVVLIENEFGEIGIDGGFLKDSGIEMKEMNSGCICCSLVGDFGTSLKEVLDTYHPDRIVIEPSGVGKLSDVLKAVSDVCEAMEDVTIASAVTVVDASKAKMYAKNFGEFFINQIENAGMVVLSRTGKMKQDKIDVAVGIVKEHNDHAVVLTTPWDQLDGAKILSEMEEHKDLAEEMMAEMKEHHHEHEHHHDHDGECCCGHHHDHDHEHHHHDHDEECGCGHHHDHDHDHDHHHHDHDEECGCGHHHDHEHEHHHHHDHDGECSCGHHHHHHDADEVFTSWGKETAGKYSRDEISAILENFDVDDTYGIILRAKGMLPDENGNWTYFDFVPGEIDVREGTAEVTGKICVIGSKLKEEKLAEIFSK